MTYFGNQLRELRKKKSVSQKELAFRLGIVQSTIANYEKGLRFPDQKILLEIASIFNVSIDYLLGRESYSKPWYLIPESRDFIEAFFSNEKEKAKELIESRINNMGTNINNNNLIKLYLEMFDYPMEYIGYLWNEGKIDIAEVSRFATFSKTCMSMIQNKVTSLFNYLIKDKSHVNLLLLPVCGEGHNLGIRIINDYIEMIGYNTFLIEENIPITDIIEFINKYEIHILMLSVTMQYNEDTTSNIIKAVRNDYDNKVKIIAGGPLFNINKGLWYDIGADNYAESINEIKDIILTQEQKHNCLN